MAMINLSDCQLRRIVIQDEGRNGKQMMTQLIIVFMVILLTGVLALAYPLRRNYAVSNEVGSRVELRPLLPVKLFDKDKECNNSIEESRSTRGKKTVSQHPAFKLHRKVIRKIKVHFEVSDFSIFCGMFKISVYF